MTAPTRHPAFGPSNAVAAASARESGPPLSATSASGESSRVSSTTRTARRTSAIAGVRRGRPAVGLWAIS